MGFPIAMGQFPFTAFQGFTNFFRPIQNAIQPFVSGIQNMMGFGPKFIDDGTVAPVATGNDPLFPDDCGRDPDKGTGKLCFPDGLLCQNRVSKGGVQTFNGHLYWFSWQDNDANVKNAKWGWFNARNYCRKRCMDLVSFETQQEYDWVKGFINGNVPYFWTSGRLCDFDGCDRPDFFPKNINGWFWSCMAVLNNFYGDGIKWHDIGCHHEKPIICEDVEGHLQFARQTFPNIRIP